MNARTVTAIVAAMVIGLGLGYVFFGGRVAAQAQGPTDLKDRTIYQVHDTFVCDAGDPTMQAREWHFGGPHRSLRAQSTVDWYLDLDSRKVVRVFYRPAMFAKDGKKYMMVARTTERDRAREGFDANGGDRRWADVVYHNIRLERQRVVRPCGPAR